MTPAELSDTVLRAVRRAVDEGELGPGAVGRGSERIVVERPRPGGHGDYATNVALQLSRPAGRSPRQVAEVLSRRLAGSPGIAAVDVTGPGFLNFTLSARDPHAAGLLRSIRESGLAYGHGEALRGQCIDLRIPREPRAEILADAVARIGRSQGAEVEVEHPEDPGDVTYRPVPADLDPRRLGVDAGRWALLYPAAHDRPRTESVEDRAGHLAQRESNPLFRVRYAHSRTRALTRNAADLGFASDPGAFAAMDDDHHPHHLVAATDDDPHHGPHHDPHPLHHLVAALTDHPRILLTAARHRAPDRLARHLVDVADAFLADTRISVGALPQGEEKPSAAHRARLALAEATGTVLAGGLTLLGIDAPAYL
ncbi:ArgS-related anticodon-binding protein NrtL [Streptomyces sp. NPDC102467]|uniref:ArgS-related anticodon-binding protein NrtL n=1 Tax=Streptomyces sp. NPDC102467 TaxID=3366179 RepID=UPI0037FB1B1A